LAFSGVNTAASTKIALRRKNFVMIEISLAANGSLAVHSQNALRELFVPLNENKSWKFSGLRAGRTGYGL
jgi:hypothetical protein